MTRGAITALALIIATGTTLAAQQRSEPQLMLSIVGGLTTGNALWEINRQPVLNGAGNHDTLRLVRRLQSGFMLGASATYYVSPHVGVYGEIAFLGLGLGNTCRLIALDPSPANPGRNADVCDDITATDGSANTVGFFVGAAFRGAPRGFASPYFRVQGGLTTRGSSTTEVVGRFVQPFTGTVEARLVVNDPEGGSIQPAAGFAAGIMIPVAAGYQIRLELRDHLLLVDRLDGPASTLATGAPRSTTLVNNLALVFGLDIVLERKRGRRY